MDRSNHLDILDNSNINIIFTSSLSIIQDKLKYTKFNSENLNIIIKVIMEEVEETPIKGIQQKILALKIYEELVKAMKESEEKNLLLNFVNNNTISNLIDLIVDATKGNLNINTIKKVSTSCLTLCAPFLFKKLVKKLNN